MKNVNLPPLAASFTESIRDIGYSLNSAIADIIDNSISAEAKNIQIFSKNDEGDISFAIIDDGIGLEEEELVSAMRLGSKNPLEERDLNDLGRFGLGMKTASFSQCRRLTVVSSKNGIKSSAQWDLDRIAETNMWDLSVLDDAEIGKLYEIESLGMNGTLILWENCDRIVDTTVEGREVFYEKLESLEGHLKLVFHRFFEGNKIKVTINNSDPLSYFDPFARKYEPTTQKLPSETVTIDGKEVTIQAYILPHHSKITPQEYNDNAGEGGYLKNQGFYVYRGRRLITHGTWFRMKPKSELAKLTRIQIDLPNNLDHEWKIDAMKSQATPPQIIRNKLKTLIETFFSKSKRIYTHQGIKKSTVTDSYWIRTSKRGSIKYSINEDHPDISDLSQSLNDEQIKEFKLLFKDIAQFFPKEMFFSDYGSKPESFDSSYSDEELEVRALTDMKKHRHDFTIDNYISKYKNGEPYWQYSKSWEDFVEENYAEL